MPYGTKALYPTPQITTGNVATVADSTQQNFPLGGGFKGFDTSGNAVAYKYVKLAGSGLATVTAGTPVYWTDAAKTTVTNTVTAALTYAAASDAAIGSAAGILLNGSAAAGNFVWIQTHGYNASITAPASTAKGDLLVLSNAAASAPTNNTLVRVAAGTAPATPEAVTTLYIAATGSVSGGIAPGLIQGSCGSGF